MFLYSIIIPAYNVGELLAECLDSIKEQTYKNWEIILVDDGSNDAKTSKICDKYSMLDTRIHTYHLTNKGALLTREFGAEHAKGEYCFFVDADDRIYPTALHDVNAIIETESPDVVLFRAKMEGERIHKYSPKLFEDKTIIYESGKDREQLIEYILVTSKLNPLWLKIIKKELAAVDVSMYSGIAFGNDHVKSMPILLKAQKIYYLDKVLYFYRNNPMSTVHQPNNKEKLKLRYESMCRRHNARETFLKEYNLDNKQNLQKCHQVHFQDKIELAELCMKSLLLEEEKKKFVYKIFHDDSMRKIEEYCYIKKMKNKNKFYYWLYKHGLLEKFLMNLFRR